MQLSRRNFLKSAAAAGLSSLVYGMFPERAWALSNNGTKVLFMNMNGGLDGLSALQPASGALYSTLAELRPTLSLAPGALLPATSSFGFHPNLTLFKSLFDEGKLSAVMSVGYKNMSRSHQDAEVAFARGAPDRLGSSKSGFLDRLGAHYGWHSLQAVSVSGTDPAFEGGNYRGIQVRGLQDFYYRGFTGNSADMLQLVDTNYSIAKDSDGANDKQRSYLDNVELAAEYTDAIQDAVKAHTVTMPYPSTQFGRALRDIDVLFSSAGLNTQIGYMRASGFDTHSNQQPTLDRLLLELNAALTAFVDNMKAKGIWNNLVIVIFSEFGRTNRENGSAGTDHGGANPVLLAGGPVAGGGLFGDLTTTELTQTGWLPMRYNVVELYRRLLLRMDLDPNPIFPSSDGPSLAGLFT